MSDWKDVLSINLNAVFQLCQLAGRNMLERGYGKIINMASMLSFFGGFTVPAYAASKGGVLAYAKNVAMRIAPYQATCNSLDFGGVMTELNRPVMEDKKLWDQIMDLTPLKRWMTVDEAAEWIYFMAVKNRFCTGQNILIDGLEAGNCNFIWPDET